MLYFVAAVVVLAGLGLFRAAYRRRSGARAAPESGESFPEPQSRPRNVGADAPRSTPTPPTGSGAFNGHLGSAVGARRDDVRFTVYRPASVAPEQWSTLLVFAHRAEGPLPGGGFQPDLSEAVRREAQTLLGERATSYRTATEDAAFPVVRDSELAFVPEIDGVQFNPPRVSLTWSEAMHRVEFRMKAATALEGTIARGYLTIFSGPIVVAQMTLVMRVSIEADARDVIPSTVAPFRRVFASYSHSDAEVVHQVREYARAMGDEYLIDVADLRAGERWEPRLEQLIREADVFQLFWSSNAMRSRYVQQEYQYALSLDRAQFIRPVYWEVPLPAAIDEDLPPQALRAVHFQRIGVGRTLVVPDVGRDVPRAPVAASAASAASAAPASGPPPRATAAAPSRPTRVGSSRVKYGALATAAVLVLSVGIFSQYETARPASDSEAAAAAPAPMPGIYPGPTAAAPAAADPPPRPDTTATGDTTPLPGDSVRPALLLGGFDAPSNEPDLQAYMDDVRVQSRLSLRRFRVTVLPPGADPANTARPLGIDEVATVRVRFAADDLVVTVRLTDVRRGRVREDSLFIAPTTENFRPAAISTQIARSVERMHTRWR